MSLVGALQGLRVLDFSRVLAGPLCTMLLADLGAAVLKIERPGAGDDTRAWGPPFVGEESAYFRCVNRGKRSLALDLAAPEGQARARNLAGRVDVLVENFRVGAMAEFGLGYDQLRESNPRLIYCSITGYGQDGPDAALPGYDFLAQGRGGLMSVTGAPTGEPMKVGVAVTDLTAGLFAHAGILAALQKRTVTGLGEYLDLSLLDCQVAGLLNVAANALATSSVPQRHGNAHPNIVPYQLFHASDRPFLLAVGNDGQWGRCCRVLGRPEWAADARFASNPARVRHRELLVPELAEIIATRTVESWLAAFTAAGVPAGPIRNALEVFQDPQVLARGMLLSGMDSRQPGNRQVANPLLRGETRGVPPKLGEGGEELAAAWERTPPPSNPKGA